jgi:ribosomal protein S18 acetylase RimI-like enzyme
MSQRLEKRAGLSESQLAYIRQLEQSCNQFEGLTMKLNWATLRSRPTNEINDFLFYEDDNKPVGYLALYTFNKKEAEVSAMTHPDYRQRGVFKQLLATAQAELKKRNIPDILFICEQVSASGTNTMKGIGAGYDFSEYKMNLKEAVKATSKPELLLRPAYREDVADLARMDEICFDVPVGVSESYLASKLSDLRRTILIATVGTKPVGKIQVLITDSETYISGFCMFPEYRRQGYGTMILTDTVQQLVTRGHENITLEVEANNRSALSLYEHCGFEVTTAYDYYRLPVKKQR